MPDLEMYNTVCRGEFQEIKEYIGEVSSDLKALRKVLLGNGEAGITTKIEQNKKDIGYLGKAMGWAISVATAILTAVLIGGVWGIVNHLQGKP